MNFKKLPLLLLIFTLFTVPCQAETVRLAQFGKSKFLFYLPLYIAMEEGYFKEEGIEIDLIFAGNDDQVFATLVSGSADFAVGDPIFSAVGAERGFQSKTIALMTQRLALYGYTSNSDMKWIQSPPELSGLNVSSFPAPSTTFTMLSSMNDGLGQNERFRIVEATPGTALHLLKSAIVDIAVDLEPAPSIAESHGKKVVFNLAQFFEPQAVTGLMASQQTIDQNGETAQKMVRALNRGLRIIHQNPDVAHRVARSLFPELEAKVISRSVNRIIDSGCYPATAIIPEEHWQNSQKLRVERGDLRSMQPIEVAVDNRFAVMAQEQ